MPGLPYIVNPTPGMGGGSQRLDHGFKFEYLTAATIRMAFDGDIAIEDAALVWVTDGSTWTSIEIESASLPLTLDLSTTGAGGILAAHAPEAVQGYDIYLITEAAGANPALMAVDSGTDMSGVSLPGSYTMWSRLIWFVSNTLDAAANIIPFTAIGCSECDYDDRYQFMTADKVLVRTLIDLTPYVPSKFKLAWLLGRSGNWDTDHVQADFFRQSTGNRFQVGAENLRAITGGTAQMNYVVRVVNVNGPADSLYYLHDILPTHGTDIAVGGWRLQ